jgi:hypothetical protein
MRSFMSMDLVFQILVWQLQSRFDLAGIDLPEIPLAEKGICRGNKAQSGFRGCEGPQPSRLVAFDQDLKSYHSRSYNEVRTAR